MASKPSRDVRIVDAPDVEQFEAEFVYNHFVADEGVNALAGVPTKLLERPGESFDSKTIDYLASGRVPRYVRMTWKPIHVRDRVYGQSTYEQDVPAPAGYLRDNLELVLDETHFASQRFVGLTFSDQSIDSRMHAYVSSSALVLNSRRQLESSANGLALETNEITSDQVTYDFLAKHLVRPSEDGVFVFERDATKLQDDTVETLKNFRINAQINAGIVSTLVKRASAFPESIFGSAYLSSYDVASRAQSAAIAAQTRDPSVDDYRVRSSKYVSLSSITENQSSLATRVRAIGYIVDRFEIANDGTSKRLQPIVVEGSTVSSTVDLRVKYYGRYQYAVRSVIELSVPSVIEDTGEFTVAKFLVASRASVPRLVDCRESVPPPPPADTRFVWDWEADRLSVGWVLPPNSQRDVKQVQVFRRASLSESFQLVRQFDFDDSKIRADYAERPDPRLITRTTTPRQSWLDDDFDRSSAAIYALGTVDAHGIVSNYGPQTMVKFDRNRNRLIAKRVSQAGAPRSYPNWLVDEELFSSSIVEAGKRKMNVAFTPEHYKLIDSESRDLGFLATDRDGGSYKITVANLDVAKASTVEITIVDRRTTQSREKTLNDPFVPDYGDVIAKNGRK